MGLLKIGVHVIIIGVVLKIIHDLGIFQQIKETTDYQCQYLKDMIIGPEDFVKYGQNTLLVSSADNLNLFHKLPANQVQNGGIYAIYQADQVESKVQKLQIQGFPSKLAFFPLGIDEHNGKLFVINNAYDKGGERIEVLQIKGNEGNYTLQYLYSITFPDNFMGALNDLIVIGDNKLLTTTWINFPDPIEGRVKGTMYDILTFLKRIFYQIIKVKNTYIYSCSFTDKNEVAKCQAFENTAAGLHNGIQWDKKDTIAVSKTLDKMVSIYKIKDDALLHIDDVVLNTLTDNIWFNQQTNSFFVGSGIRAYDYIRHQLFYTKDDQNVTYWGSIDEIYQSKENSNVYQSKNVLVKRNAVFGMSGCIIVGENLYLSNWPDKTLGVCRKNKNQQIIV